MIIIRSMGLAFSAPCPNDLTFNEAVIWCSNLGEGWELPGIKDMLFLQSLNFLGVGGVNRGWFWLDDHKDNAQGTPTLKRIFKINDLRQPLGPVSYASSYRVIAVKYIPTQYGFRKGA